MDRKPKRIADPAAHRSGKAELNDGAGINAAPEALARAVTRGGAKRREREKEAR